MNISYAPIVSEPNQPDDFTEVLDSIEFFLKHFGMSWRHERVVALVRNLHAKAGYAPATYEFARFALSYQQLKAIEKKLKSNAHEPKTSLAIDAG